MHRLDSSGHSNQEQIPLLGLIESNSSNNHEGELAKRDVHFETDLGGNVYKMCQTQWPSIAESFDVVDLWRFLLPACMTG